jgi:hypothetical protein
MVFVRRGLAEHHPGKDQGCQRNDSSSEVGKLHNWSPNVAASSQLASHPDEGKTMKGKTIAGL